MDECHPFEAPNFVEAWCLDNTDSSYVEDNGYEAKIVISDSACQAVSRTGGASDISKNCYYYHQSTQISDLPSAYRDTTLGDPGPVLVIGFGSADAASIDPGTTYLMKQFFRSQGQPVIQNTDALHVGSITTRLLSGAACITGGFADNRCYYAVDVASVGGSSGDTFDQVIFP
ncbi:MAG: hypothetical protein L0Y45_00765 [Woeseiaceae bacterium]|nr:hypothetical protein [Woeseiaceae bacterium]